jgi:hypothetical protein
LALIGAALAALAALAAPAFAADPTFGDNTVR